MKIVYIHQYFVTPSMPGGTRSYEMARRLVERGHEVHMVTSWREDGGDTCWFETEEDGIHVYWLPVPYSNHMSYVQRIRAFFRFALLAARKAASLQADVVFATSTPLTIALPAVYAARKQRIPMVFEVRDLWPELPIAIGVLRNPFMRRAAQWLERWAYKNSEAVVALSPGMRDGVVGAGYPQERVAVIPNSSDIDFFCGVDTAAVQRFRAERSWLGGRRLLVYTGTFGRINGVGWTVELARYWLDVAPELRILLVGDGQEAGLVRRKAQDAGVLGKNLFIEPPMPKRDMPILLAAADMASSFFIDLPEMRANSANKFFDALAAGKPVLLNYGGWQAELVESAECGYVAWGKPMGQVARELAVRMSDQQWLDDAGKASAKLASSCFDRDVLARQLEFVLDSALKCDGGRASLIASGVYDAACISNHV